MTRLKKFNQPCPDCNSSDGLAIYTDGTYCFSCGVSKGEGKTNFKNTHKIEDESLLEELIFGGTYEDLPNRGLSAKTLEQFEVKVTKDENGKPEKVLFPCKDENGMLVAQKFRDKDHLKGSWVGDKKKAKNTFFGQHLWSANSSKNKTLTITEGEFDCMALYEIMGNWPVVSIFDGVLSMKRHIKEQSKFLQQFDTVKLFFDNDSIGKQAMLEVAPLLPVNRVEFVNLEGFKDANEALLAGKEGVAAVKAAWFGSKVYAPEGLVGGSEDFDTLFVKQEFKTAPYPFRGLNKETLGLRAGEMVTVIAGCVDKDTEYLTPTGWKKISEYDDGEVVAQYDKNSQRISFVKPENYIKLPCDRLYHIKTKYGVDQMLSEEHNVFSVSVDGVEKLTPLKEVMAKHNSQVTGFRDRIPTTFKPPFVEGFSGEFSSEDELRLMVAVIADGHYPERKNTKPSCRVRLKKCHKQKRLEMLLAKTDVEVKYIKECAPYEEGWKVYEFYTPFNTKVFDQRFWNLSERELEVFCDEVLKWDGNGKNAFFSSVKENADFVQYAFTAIGKRASISEYDRQDGNVEYTVTVTQKHSSYVSFRKTTTAKPEFKEVVPEDGYKYCFTVPTGLLVLRRNGNIFVTGNSGSGKSCLTSEIAYNLMKNTDDNIGLMFLEETIRKTKFRFMSLEAEKRLEVLDMFRALEEIERLPAEEQRKRKWLTQALEDKFPALVSDKDSLKGMVDRKYLKELHDKTIGAKNAKGEDRFVLFDHFGSSNVDKIIAMIKAMVKVHDCKWLILDHISILVSDQDNGDERKALDEIATKLRTAISGSDVGLIMVAHLKRGSGKPHEEGGKVSLADIRGTAGIGQLSDIVLGLERNGQADCPIDRNITTIRVVKNRFLGDTGEACKLYYNHQTGRMEEVTEEEIVALKEDLAWSKQDQLFEDNAPPVMDSAPTGERVSAEKTDNVAQFDTKKTRKPKKTDNSSDWEV